MKAFIRKIFERLACVKSTCVQDKNIGGLGTLSPYARR